MEIHQEFIDSLQKEFIEVCNKEDFKELKQFVKKVNDYDLVLQMKIRIGYFAFGFSQQTNPKRVRYLISDERSVGVSLIRNLPRSMKVAI